MMDQIGQWVSVRERLPADGQRVWFGADSFALYGTFKDGLFMRWKGSHPFAPINVTHWMPAPLLPGEG